MIDQPWHTKEIEQMSVFGRAPLMAGFMDKRKWGIWRQRWFVLSTDGLLFRYINHESEFPREVPIDIKTYTALKARQYKVSRYRYGIELVMPDQMWIFACDTLQERDEWMRHFRAVHDL